MRLLRLRARGEACSFVEDGAWPIGPGPTYWCLPLRLAHHDLGFGPFTLFGESCLRHVSVVPSRGYRVREVGVARFPQVGERELP